VNVVGYVNTELKPGWNLICNPLDNTATDGNKIKTLFTGLPEGSSVNKYVRPTGCGAGGYETTRSVSFGSFMPDGELLLAPGEGAFIWLEGTAAVTVTFVGDVKQGSLSTPICVGFNMVSSQVPQAGTLTELGFVASEGDSVYQHDKGVGYKTTQVFSFGTWSPGPEPTIGVGEAFWVDRVATDGKNWDRTFKVE
jgi:hypothetical protein